MNRLRPRRAPPRAGLHASLLATVGLMMLLLPVLLVTTSPDRLTSSPLRLVHQQGQTPPHRGPLASLVVLATPSSLTVRAQVRRADVRARVEDTTLQEVVLPAVDDALDLPGLQSTLRRLSSLDPQRKQLTLQPDPELTTAQWVRVMDAVRRDREGELFPQIAVQDPG